MKLKVGDKVLAQEVESRKWLPGVITELGTQPGLYWVQIEGYPSPVVRAKGTVKRLPVQERLSLDD